MPGRRVPGSRDVSLQNPGGPVVVELGGIEPPSARWSPDPIRPFLHSGLDGYRTGRSAEITRISPPGLSPMSAVFHAVSGLSLRSIPASVAGLR